MTVPVKRPNIDLVGVTWLRAVPGMPVNSVATALPKVNGEVDVTALRSGGFARWRSGMGGSSGASGLRRPVGTVECWAAPDPGSSQVPWGRASDLAETIYAVANDEHHSLHRVRLTLPHGYGDVLVHSVNALGEPVKVEGDPSGFARFDVDLEINWTGVPA